MKRWTPVWKDEHGNRVIFPARNQIFEEEYEATSKAIDMFLWMVAFGFSIDKPIQFDMREDGHTDIEHVAAKAGRLGECAILSGPAFDKHVNYTEKEATE